MQKKPKPVTAGLWAWSELRKEQEQCGLPQKNVAPDVDRGTQFKQLEEETARLKGFGVDLTLGKTILGPILDYLDSCVSSIPLTHA
jgi:hypothetical protein